MSRSSLRRASFEALLGLFVSITGVEGQGLSSIPANARVRIDFPTADRSRFERLGIGRSQPQSVSGTVEAVRADTLVLLVRSGAEPLRIPRAVIGSVYLSGGRPPRWRAAIDGALLPSLVTAALSAAGASIHRRPGDPSPGQAAVSGALWVGVPSALLAAWSPKERWRPIVLPTPSTH